MAYLTPQDPRRLSFGTNALSNFTNPSYAPFSPYTPGRAAEAAVNVAPRISSPFANPNGLVSRTPEPSEEAETFVAGGLKSHLRAISLYAVSVARKSINTQTQQEVALNFLTHIIEETTTLYSLSESLYEAPTIRPSTRRQVAVLREQLILELRTWILLKCAWTVPKRRAEDLVTRRLQLSAPHLLALLEVPGIVKVQHVIEWLEKAAADELKRTGGPMVHPLNDPAYRWQYTAKNHEGEKVSMDFPLHGKAGGVPPDVDSIEDIDPLDEIERKAEVRLAREVFRLIRAGLLDEAEQVCRDAGQPWRAAALAGGRNASSLGSNGMTGSARKSWRKAAKALANTTRTAVPIHERAVAGVLCGVLQPVLVVCKTYDDQLWARLSVLLDSSVEKVLTTNNGEIPNEAEIYDEKILETFRECEPTSDVDAPINIEVLSALRNVQAYIALGIEISEEHRVAMLDALTYLAKLACEHRLEWACRLAVQIGLFLKYSGSMESEDDAMIRQFDTIVQGYVQFVIDSNAEDDEDPFQRNSNVDERASVCSIAANFLAEMDNMNVAIATYSRMMQTALRADLMQEAAEARRAKVLTQNIEERRVLCLEEAGSCFAPDVLAELTKHAVDQIWKEFFDEGSGTTPSLGDRGSSVLAERRLTTTSMDTTVLDSNTGPDKDEMVIRSIEFLTFSAYPNYGEALVRTTSAIRRFFLLQKRETARRITNWFPSHVVEGLDANVYGIYIREVHCWNLYFRALTHHNDWYVYKTSNQPRPIPDSVRQAALAQPVQKEAKDKLHMYNSALREYQNECDSLMGTAVAAIYDALMFDNLWMSNVVDASDMHVDAERAAQLEAIRKTVISEFVSLLHHMFHKSGRYKEAAELFILIARDEFELYKYIEPTELKAMLAKGAESTIKLADETANLLELKPPYEGHFFEDFSSRGSRENARVTFAE